MKDFYELLGVKPSATENEIREAYMKLKKIFSRENPSLYSIYDDEEIGKLMQDIQEAASILLDSDKRKNYDRLLVENKMYPESLFKIENISDGQKSEIPPPLFAEIQEEGAGLFFKKVRESMGLDIKEVARITRIQTAYLEAIENENFEKLPPRVFVRGFVISYAKLIKVGNLEKVVNEYMKKYDERMNKK